MTSEELCLLAAVLSAPGNDLPRSIYADWLEENGRAERAELIRVQCELAWLEVGGDEPGRKARKVWTSSTRRLVTIQEAHHDRYVLLAKRERELLYGSARWLPAGVVSSHVEGPVRADPGGAPVGVWGRGFVEHIVCTAGDWLAHADEIYWRPGLRCEPCDGSGDKASHYPDGNLQFLGPCEDCNGAGAVPCPPTAHPVRRVRLTTGVFNLVDVVERAIRNGFRPPSDRDWGDGSTVPVGTPMAKLLGWAWPGVEFELPPERSLEQALRDDPPTPGERAVYDGTWFAPRPNRGACPRT